MMKALTWILLAVVLALALDDVRLRIVRSRLMQQMIASIRSHTRVVEGLRDDWSERERHLLARRDLAHEQLADAIIDRNWHREGWEMLVPQAMEMVEEAHNAVDEVTAKIARAGIETAP